MALPSKKDGKVHIARNGTVIGQYDADKVGDLLDTGGLKSTDHYYDNDRKEWRLLSTYSIKPEPEEPDEDLPEPIVPLGAPVSDEPSASDDPAASGDSQESRRRGSKGRRSSRSKEKAKKKSEAAVLGWIACLFALGVAAGIWAWAGYLGDQLKVANEKIRDLDNMEKGLRREIQLLTEITPPGRVRGVITYEPAPNQVAIMSGATVGLYEKRTVEQALASAVSNPNVTSAEEFDSVVERLKSTIGTPLQISLTDSNGRIDLPIQNEGDYVLVASAAKSGNAGTERYFWLIGFSANKLPSGLVLMNESNAISMKKRQFGISKVRPLAVETSNAAEFPAASATPDATPSSFGLQPDPQPTPSINSDTSFGLQPSGSTSPAP